MNSQDLAARVELIRSQKRPKRQADYLTIEEFETVLKSIKIFKFIDLRDKVIFQMLFFSGARVEELVNLKLQDVIFTSPTSISLFLFGKGRKERNVPIMEKSTIKNVKKFIELSMKYFEVSLENKNITPHSFDTLQP